MAEAMEVEAVNDEDLLKAAESGNVEVFEELEIDQLKKAASIRNEDARSLLHVAAAAGNLRLVRILAGIEPSLTGVNGGDEEGWTPLHSAVSSGRDDVVEALLQAGADVSIANNGGRTALHYAASKGRLKIAQVLISHGAKINQKDKFGCTPLHRAASAGHPELCEMLIEEGADVDATDKTGQTPLMHAVICNDKQVALLLVRNSADVDCEDGEGYTVLGRASNELRSFLVDAARVMLE
ncbi:hypothetical protein KI387_030380, partial [Taxus chinensis]